MNESKEKVDVKKEIISWVLTILLAVAIVVPIRAFAYESMQVPTGSMIHTIEIGDTFFVNKFVYHFQEIKRGDIAVFWYPDNPTVRYVKRVMGVGGDVLEIKDNTLYVNNEPQVESYLREPMTRGDFSPVKVPADHYFMMGDNRNESNDARYWKNQFVSKNAIIGRPDLRYFPLNRIGLIR